MTTDIAVYTQKFLLQPDNPQRLANLCGNLDSHLIQIARYFDLKIYNRGNKFQISGDEDDTRAASTLLKRLYRETHNGTEITPDLIHLLLQENKVIKAHTAIQTNQFETQDGLLTIKTPQITIKPRGPHQQDYLQTIQEHDINFGIGPAGTGKTYLAVACAVQALMRDEIKRILLVRPAVEAGEKLGFLPGDLSQKIDPYLRPLYDALYEMLGTEQVARLIERNVIEVAPLAYMRGRTLSNCFVILDESQNTTPEQMKMFLTRIGFGSTAVITGDITQVDLPRGTKSGLRQVMQVLDGVEGIGMIQFSSRDVVRHPLVQKVVEAYDTFEAEQDRLQKAKRAQQQAKDHE